MIGKIAAIEIPAKEWSDLIAVLDANITKQSANSGLRQASLEALGYVCEEVPAELQPYSNQILTAIASGMADSEANTDIKLSATVCLVNSIEFIKGNMAQEADRNMIMQMVFSVTKSTDLQVRVAAYQALVQIADSYYEYLGSMMGAIFSLTTAAIKSEVDEVAQQAIELWSTICDVELEIMEEEYVDPEAPPPSQPAPPTRNQGFIKAAVPHLVPVLLSALTKQSEDPDDDEWNVALASGTALGLCAQVAKDDIVAFVLPFVQQHVSSADWRFREAAILSFGCILDGPNQTELAKVVKQAFGLILGHMKDPHPMVKDTTAWTVGRICSLLPEVIEPATLPALMQVLVAGLSETPKVASNVCWAIHNLASAVEPDEATNSSPLSPYFQPVMQALLQTASRGDVKECNLQVSVYEAINVMVTSAAGDVHHLIKAILPMIMEKLRSTLQQRSENAGDKEALNEIQALLCGSLQAIVTKLEQGDILPQSDVLMQLLLEVLNSKNTTVHEEALMAVGAVADKIEDHFVKYQHIIKTPLLQGLTNAQEYHVCNVAVHVTCDLTRAIGAAFAPWGDEVMGILLRHLQNPSIERTLKAHIIACIGDIALAVGGYFERYMQYVIPMLRQASQIRFEADDYENQDYLQHLRDSIIQAYSGILLGLAADNKVQSFLSQAGLVDSITALFDLIAADIPADSDNRTQAVIRGASGLIFDLVSRGGAQVRQQLLRPAVEQIIKRALHEDMEPETQKNGKAAQRVSEHTHAHTDPLPSLLPSSRFLA